MILVVDGTNIKARVGGRKADLFGRDCRLLFRKTTELRLNELMRDSRKGITQ